MINNNENKKRIRLFTAKTLRTQKIEKRIFVRISIFKIQGMMGRSEISFARVSRQTTLLFFFYNV